MVRKGQPMGGGGPRPGQCLRHFPYFLTACAFSALFLFGTAVAPSQQIRTCFTPEYHGGSSCTDQVIAALRKAQNSILIQAYSFTSAPIAMALVEAFRRGVSVRVILDKSNIKETYSSATFLRNMGIPPLIDSEHAIAHSKVLIVDGREVITGSFNFTKAAEQKNAENIVFIDDPAVAAAYTRNWQDHAAHSLPMGAVGKVNRSPTTTAPLAAEEDQESKPLVVGNRRSKIYEWQGCPAYNAISPRNRVEFPSRQAAEAAGYRAARNCP